MINLRLKDPGGCSGGDVDLRVVMLSSTRSLKANTDVDRAMNATGKEQLIQG